MQEYAAPQPIDTHVAKQRFDTVKRAVKEFAGDRLQKCITKSAVAKRRGSVSAFKNESSEPYVVSEGRARFEVNLSDYLDTGLF